MRRYIEMDKTYWTYGMALPLHDIKAEQEQVSLREGVVTVRFSLVFFITVADKTSWTYGMALPLHDINAE